MTVFSNRNDLVQSVMINKIMKLRTGVKFIGTLLFTLLYIIVHNVYSFWKFISSLPYIVPIFFCVRHEFIPGEINLKCVHKEARKLNKIPTHLTILVGQEDLSVQEVVNLILWSLAAGISFVSFYDSKGLLVEKEDKLKKAVDQQVGEKAFVIWHTRNHEYKNGVIGRKVHVKIFSPEDGRNSLVRISKLLPFSEKVQPVTMDLIDSHLRAYYEFPDPDLGVYFGEFFNLFGYPPWQIRVTEFLNVETRRCLTDKCFVDLLRRYSKCDQRLGK